MRTVASEIGFRERRGQVGMGSRAAALRKARRRRWPWSRSNRGCFWPRCRRSSTIQMRRSPSISRRRAAHLAAVRPTLGDNATTSNESSPTIVIDPNDAQKLVAVWTTHQAAVTSTTSIIEGAYSTNAGLSWTSMAVQPTKATIRRRGPHSPRTTDADRGLRPQRQFLRPLAGKQRQRPDRCGVSRAVQLHGRDAVGRSARSGGRAR